MNDLRPLPIQIEALHALIGHVAVELTDGLVRGVHGEDGNAGIDGVDVAVGHEERHGAAAALIHLAQLRHLPDDAISAKIFRRVPTTSAEASLLPDLPPRPVNLQMPMP